MSGMVLVVDDSKTVRQQVGIALGQAGFEVLEAVDGQKGLETFQSTPDLNVMIADVNMPNMNGLEMVEAIHANASLPRIPILMLTTEGKPNLIDRAKKAGVKGWIIKPFKADLLVATVKKLAG